MVPEVSGEATAGGRDADSCTTSAPESGQLFVQGTALAEAHYPQEAASKALGDGRRMKEEAAQKQP